MSTVLEVGRSAVRTSWRDRVSSPATRQPSSPHEQRVAKLQEHFQSQLSPPSGAEAWPDRLLRHWFESGGTLLCSSLQLIDPASQSATFRYLGMGLPVRPLEPTVQSDGGLLGAAGRGEQHVFDQLADQIAHR